MSINSDEEIGFTFHMIENDVEKPVVNKIELQIPQQKVRN